MIDNGKRNRNRAPLEDDGTKICSSCGEEWPREPDYYNRDSKEEDGFRKVCRACRSAERTKKENEERDARLARLETGALQLIDQMVETGSDVPHMSELYQRLMEVFQGPAGFARHYMAQYLSAKPGSATREKMLNRLMSLSEKVSTAGAAQIPLDLMQDADLHIAFEERAKTLLIDDNSANTRTPKAS